jgi:hypothetical protein
MAEPRPDVKGETPLEVQHITVECRQNRSLQGAYVVAMDELWEVYREQVGRHPEATISIAIYRTS